MMQNGNAEEESSTSISLDSNSRDSISSDPVPLEVVVPWSGTASQGTEREVRYGTVVPGWSRASSAQAVFRFSRPAPLCRIIVIGLGSVRPRAPSRPAQISSPQPTVTPSPTHHSSREPQLPSSSHGATAGTTKRYTPPTHRDPISSPRIGFILRIRVSFPCPLVF